MASPDKPNQPPSLISAGAVLPKQRLLEMYNLRYLSQAIYVAIKKRIANIVTPQAPVHVSEVAKKLDCHEMNLYRLMSFLASYGIFEEKEGQLFLGTELSNAMRDDVPQNFYHMILSYGSEPQGMSTINLELALDKNSEKTPFERVNGEPFYTYLSHHSEQQRTFDLGVIGVTLPWQTNIPSYYDFSRYSRIVDVAGGCGGLLKAILLKCPTVQGTLLETPAVLKNIMPELLTEEPFKTRLHIVAGDFFEKVDVNADLFIVAMTLHCFEDTRLAMIVKNIADAMRRNPGSRLLLIEIDYEKSILPNLPSSGRQLDMFMLTVMGGRERDVNTWQSFFKLYGIKALQKIQFPPSFMGLECELA